MILHPVRLPYRHSDTAVSLRTPLPATEIHIRHLDLTAERASIPTLLPLLDPTDESRAGRCHFAVARRRFIAAHGPLRSILGWHLELPPQQLRFAYGAQGKLRPVDGSGANVAERATSGECALEKRISSGS